MTTPSAEQGPHPPEGDGHYLRDTVYGALDGVITTLAVVSGSVGAALGNRVIIILGLANIVADGLSMGASNYLGMKSELEQAGANVAAARPARHGMATFVAFVLAGMAPLLAYLLPVPQDLRFPLAAVLGALTLYLVGAGRARFIGRGRLTAGVEMLMVGGGAAFAAFLVGRLADVLL